MKKIKLPAVHMPHKIELNSEDWVNLIGSDPIFRDMVSNIGVPASYFYCDEFKLKLVDLNGRLSCGTCDDQSKFLGKIYFYNPNLNIEQLSEQLQAALPSLIEHYAKKIFVKKYGSNGYEMEQHLDVAFYGKEYISAAEDGDGYEETIWLRLICQFGYNGLTQKLPRFLQIFEAYCSINSCDMPFLVAVDLSGFYMKNASIGGHRLCLIKYGDGYIFYDSNTACLYQGVLDEIIPQLFFNLFQDFIRFWADNKNQFTKSLAELLEDLIIEIALRPIITKERGLYSYTAPFTDIQISATRKTSTVVNDYLDYCLNYSSMLFFSPITRRLNTAVTRSIGESTMRQMSAITTSNTIKLA